MNHDLAKLRLKEAETSVERQSAIEFAVTVGMTLLEIEQYLDWVDHLRGTPTGPAENFDDVSHEPDASHEPDDKASCDE